MQKSLFKIDERGQPIAVVAVEFDDDNNPIGNIDSNIILTECPSGVFHQPIWNGFEWIESLPQEEIDELRKQSEEPSETDILIAQNKALTDRLEFVEDLIAEMAMMIYD